MAGIGLSFPCFLPEGENEGTILGKAVSANLTVNFATGELYADDALAEDASEFISGDMALETDDLEDEVLSVLYGCKVEDNEVTYNKDDEAPYGTLGFIRRLQRKGKKYYKGFVFPRTHPAMGNESAQTKGSSITFSTSNTNLKVLEDDNGDWKKHETFDDYADAKAYVAAACGITLNTTPASGSGGSDSGGSGSGT